MPLPFMPEVVQRVLKVLPFAAMQNVPFRIYSGDLSGRAMAEAIFSSNILAHCACWSWMAIC